jgi:hypothetical protein
VRSPTAVWLISTLARRAEQHPGEQPADAVDDGIAAHVALRSSTIWANMASRLAAGESAFSSPRQSG